MKPSQRYPHTFRFSIGLTALALVYFFRADLFQPPPKEWLSSDHLASGTRFAIAAGVTVIVSGLAAVIALTIRGKFDRNRTSDSRDITVK
jgi:hypothetical protein